MFLIGQWGFVWNFKYEPISSEKKYCLILYINYVYSCFCESKYLIELKVEEKMSVPFNSKGQNWGYVKSDFFKSFNNGWVKILFM